MNVGEIATRVKRQFGDESGVQVTDADIIRWVNDAQREIAGNNDLLQTVATTAVISGQREYTLPPDILLLRSIHYGGSKLTPLNSREAEEYIQIQQSGTPGTFWVWANKLNLFPTPSASDPDDLQIFYTRQPANVTVTADVPELPLEYHNRIVEYCLQQAYELDENWEAASQKAGQFVNGLAALKGKEDWDTVDYYPSITTLPDDGGFDSAGMYW